MSDPMTRAKLISPGHAVVYVPSAHDIHPSGAGIRSVAVDHGAPCQYGSTANSRSPNDAHHDPDASAPSEPSHPSKYTHRNDRTPDADVATRSNVPDAPA
jgi:hypothetical protein